MNGRAPFCQNRPSHCPVWPPGMLTRYDFGIGLVVLDRGVGELVPGLDRHLDARLLDQVVAVDEAERAGVPRHAVDPLVDLDLLLDPLGVVRHEVVRQVRRHVEQALREREARDVLELHVDDVRQPLARLQDGAHLAVVRIALAHVLQLDLDVGMGLLEHLRGLFGARRPGPDRDGGRLLELGRDVDLLGRPTATAAASSPPPQAATKVTNMPHSTTSTSRQREPACFEALLTVNPPRCSPGDSPRAPEYPMPPGPDPHHG